MKLETEIPLRRFKTLLVVDLEATCDQPQLFRDEMETIEFGAVLLRMSDYTVIDKRSWFVRPQVHPALTDYCTRLTSITQSQVDSAMTFDQVSEEVLAWIAPHRERLGWGSWGNFDRHQLEKDARRLSIESPLAGIRHTNLKDVFSKKHQTGKPRPGMQRALSLCSLEIGGTHHRGIDDARNIARIVPFILESTLRPRVQANLVKERELRRAGVLHRPDLRIEPMSLEEQREIERIEAEYRANPESAMSLDEAFTYLRKKTPGAST